MCKHEAHRLVRVSKHNKPPCNMQSRTQEAEMTRRFSDNKGAYGSDHKGVWRPNPVFGKCHYVGPGFGKPSCHSDDSLT